MSKPRLVDLFCKAGGTTRGYQLAGFHVTGVDREAQPNYCGDNFIQADVTEWLTWGNVYVYDAVHASPPCQRYSTLGALYDRDDHPDLVAFTRDTLRRMMGKRYVIENVVGAPLISPIMLCGSSFGLGVRRHRLFESNFPLFSTGCRHDLQLEPLDVTGTGGPSNKPRPPGSRGGQHRKPSSLAQAREAMGIDWMTRAELTQAVPPAYTQFIGEQLLAQLNRVPA